MNNNCSTLEAIVYFSSNKHLHLQVTMSSNKSQKLSKSSSPGSNMNGNTHDNKVKNVMKLWEVATRLEDCTKHVSKCHSILKNPNEYSKTSFKSAVSSFQSIIIPLLHATAEICKTSATIFTPIGGTRDAFNTLESTLKQSFNKQHPIDSIEIQMIKH